MHVSAKADYAVRAVVELAAAGGERCHREAVAGAQDIPLNFLENILLALRRAGIVASRRGPEGGYWLARPARAVTVADVIRAVDGPLAAVRGAPPEQTRYAGTARPLQEVWIALRTNLREVLEGVTIADLVAGELPPRVAQLAGEAESWTTRTLA